MFDYYEDIITEPSEADMIIEEMKDKLHELIKDEAKSIMEDYREANSQLGNLNSEIRRKKRQVEQIEKTIKELQEKHEQADKRDMPRQYIDRFVRDYTGNFAPNDKVWIIEKNYEWIKCDKCKGERQILATVDGKEHMIRCINCNGDGRIRKTVKNIKETRIHSVHLKLCFGEGRVNIWSSDCIYVKGGDYSVDPKNLYRSREEAEEAIMTKED